MGLFVNADWSALVPAGSPEAAFGITPKDAKRRGLLPLEKGETLGEPEILVSANLAPVVEPEPVVEVVVETAPEPDPVVEPVVVEATPEPEPEPVPKEKPVTAPEPEAKQAPKPANKAARKPATRVTPWRPGSPRAGASSSP